MTQKQGMEILRGDIFYITPGPFVGSEQSSGRPGLIVSNDLSNRHSPNVEVVFLTTRDKPDLSTHVDVICKVQSTALCENIQTVSKERLGKFVRSCTTSEMKNIDKALCVSLGLTPSEKVEKAEAATAPSLSTVEVERDLYKKLYEQLLNRIMEKE